MATYSGGDMAGADLILADGDTIYGIFTNVGLFELPSGATVNLLPFNGNIGGSLEVHARRIRRYGIIDARLCGYFGYAGGGSGPGGEAKSHGGTAGGRGGGRDGDAEPGVSGEANCDVCGVGACGGAAGAAGADDHPNDKGDFGGLGGTPGAGGSNGSDGGDGGRGGYKANEANGDDTTDESLEMGSGGGAGAGAGGSGGATGSCNGCGGASGGSGASGGRGGGLVKLFASESFKGTGKVLTSGGLGLAGNAGNPNADTHEGRPGVAGAAVTATEGTGQGGPAAAGPAAYCGNNTSAYYSGKGGDGGPGAGGGVLIKCTGPWPILDIGEFDTRGGGDDEVNFGSTKIHGVKVDVSGATFNTGWNSVFGSPRVVANQCWAHPVC